MPKIRLGGPVSGPVICIHKISTLGKEIFPGVYWTYNLENIKKIISNSDDYRLYVGLTDWLSKEQLENELSLSVWSECECSEELIFDEKNREDAWKEARKLIDIEFWKKLGIKKGHEKYLWN